MAMSSRGIILTNLGGFQKSEVHSLIQRHMMFL